MTMTTDRKAKVTLLEDPRAFTIEREFDAAAELVWEAWTKPEHIRRWWTTGRGTMTVCDVDFRVGGRWRYAMDAEGHGEVAFHGEFVEIEPHSRIVSTEAYEMEGLTDEDASVNTLTLTERDGRSFLHVLVEHRTPEHRDMHINSGMEGGLQDALDLLEGVAQSLR